VKTFANFYGRNPEGPVFTYKNKGFFFRFLLVYKFYVQKLLALVWHFKIAIHFRSQTTQKEKELVLYKNLGLDSKKLFLQLGGVYVKLGQFLSNLNHVLPLEFTSHLQDLQDRLPPHPFEEIKERFEREIGRPIEEVFPDIDPSPLASASTAQVHLAEINSVKVAVKILYPNIESIVEKDIRTVLFVMKRINRYLFSFDYVTIHKELKEVITREMDLSQEAESISKMRRLFAKEKNIIFPHVYKQFTTKGILVTEFIAGVKISETLTCQYKNSKKSRALSLLIRAYILMVFKFKFFHADPHPGNLIFTPDEKLCFIDFGSVGVLYDNTEKSLRKIIVAAMSDDYYSVVEGMDEMGFFGPDVDKEQIEKIARFAFQSLQRFMTDTEYFRNISYHQLNPDDFQVYLKGMNTSLYELMKLSRIPQNYIMLERVFALLLGHVAWLDPYRTILDYSKQPFYSIVIGESSKLQKALEEEGQDILTTMFTLPREINDAISRLKTGRIQVRNKDTQKQTEKIESLARQVVYTLVSIASIHFGNFFLEQQVSLIYPIFYLIGGAFGLALFLSLLKSKT
jgi:ubiquinone biosynthesis protein